MSFLHKLGVDLLTTDVQTLVDQINASPDPIIAWDRGQYREDPYFSQVHVTGGGWEEADLEDWLDEHSTAHIFGTFTRD